MVRAGELIEERFVLDHEVASGGMGRVFRARDTRDGSAVAVKMVLDTRPKSRERFMHECAVLAEIRHPGVVRYVSHGTHPHGGAYLVMEWLDGQDLGEYLRGEGAQQLSGASDVAADADIDAVAGDLWEDTQDTVTLAPLTTVPNSANIANTRIRPSVMSEPMPVPLVLRFARRLASAVAELHRRQFIHGDIKPANLFLPGGHVEQVKLIDFGTVKLYSVGAPVDQPGRLSGTPYYMAPEQARATGHQTPATDVWAIGCVLYQCLVGMRPFVGEDLLTVLTRIVMEDPAPLHELRPDVPSVLAQLIMSALEKEPEARPADARVLQEALAALETGVAADLHTRVRADSETSRQEQLSEQAPQALQLVSGESADWPSAAPVLTNAERRVTCLLFVDASHLTELDADDFRTLAAAHGSELQRLADGTWIVTIAETRSPSEQAAQAARLALKLRSLHREVVLVLATGRVSGRGHGRAPLGPVLDSAVRALRETSPGVIQIDSLTASLLDTRFFLQRTDSGARLRSERPREVTRTLLGKPMGLVGRERELQALTDVLRDSVQRSRARALLLTGGPGIGKSRLFQEFVRGVADQPITCIAARADATSAGSAFALLTPALRRMSGIVDGESDQVQRAKLRALATRGASDPDDPALIAYLGELARVSMPDVETESMEAARRDPLFLGQLMARTWVAWLDNQCAMNPVIIAVDDLQWADVPSLQYLERAVTSLRERPLILVGFARSEVRPGLARLWAGDEVQELAIAPLSMAASRSLCRQALGGRASDQAIEQAVGLAGGNALYLEELVRTIARGQPRQTSENLLGMIQERLDGLAPEAKRVLRAASVFGKSFWQGGVQALVGNDGAFNVSEWLDDLVLSEAIHRRPASRMPGDIEYEFRSELTREGAYAMLVDDDRELGHQLAGAWLERSGSTEPHVLAEHFVRGGASDRAVSYYHRAAVQALEGNDLVTALSCTEEAERHGARGELLGRVRALRAVAFYWRGEYIECERCGREALMLLTPGSSQWLDALGNAMVSCYRMGESEMGDELFERGAHIDIAADARESQISLLCRGAMQYILDGRGGRAQPLFERISAEIAGSDRPMHRVAGQFHNALGLQAILGGDWQRVIEHFQTSVAAFAAIGDTVNAVAERAGIAYALAELGAYERAAKLARQALVDADQVGARSSRALNRVNLGYILTYIPGFAAEARVLLQESVAEYRARNNPRMHGFALTHMARLESQCGNHDSAEELVRRAIAEFKGSSGYLPWALAVHAGSLLACDRPEQALARAEEAVATLEAMGLATHGENLPALVLAQALRTNRRYERANCAIADARARILARCALITDPDLKNSFLAKEDSRQIMELAASWLGS